MVDHLNCILDLTIPLDGLCGKPDRKHWSVNKTTSRRVQMLYAV